MPIRSALAALATLCLLLASPAAALTVTLNLGGTSNIYSRVSDGSTTVDDLANPASLPFVDSTSASIGGNSSDTGYVLTDSGFDITFDHTRASTAGSLGESFGTVHFQVDQDVTYEALGTYTAIDPDGRQVFMHNYLYDETLGQAVYQSYQLSLATPNEAFILGGAGGDNANIQFGSLTGALIAGHDYTYNYDVFVNAHNAGTTSATGARASHRTYGLPAMTNHMRTAIVAAMTSLDEKETTRPP